ncbi:MAG: acyl-CoA thioesterase [Acidobacteria bacterium]|nr:acyl-CoA thioesterase [Acidobacteriota bacterium]
MSSTTPHAMARVRVRYAETDQMGVVYHANYLVWFEVARVEILRSLGLSYKQFEAEGFMIAVIDAHVRYRSPAKYDDDIAIEARIEALRGSLMRFTYRVMRVEDSTLLAEGETTHIVVNKTMEKTALPQHYAEAFRNLMNG